MKRILLQFTIILFFTACIGKGPELKMIDYLIENPEKIDSVLKDTSYVTKEYLERNVDINVFANKCNKYIREYFQGAYDVTFYSHENLSVERKDWEGWCRTEIMGEKNKKSLNIFFRKINGSWKFDDIIFEDNSILPPGS